MKMIIRNNRNIYFASPFTLKETIYFFIQYIKGIAMVEIRDLTRCFIYFICVIALGIMGELYEDEVTTFLNINNIMSYIFILTVITGIIMLSLIIYLVVKDA